MKKAKKIAFTVLKIGISILLLYWVFKKIPLVDIWSIIKTSDVYLLCFALLFFLISQLISAERLWRYFKGIGYHFSRKSNGQLYLVGMLYNFFIPGGIGGDAYKVYLLQKEFGWSVKKLSAAVLADRLSGLLAIVILIQIFGVTLLSGYFQFLIILSVSATFFIAKWGFSRFFPSFKNIFLRSFILSLLVQGLQLLTLFCIANSFAAVENIEIYFLIFLLSTVLSVLSFSGIGIREWVFMKASFYLNFDSKISVAIAMIFTAISAFVALFGILIQLKGLKLKTQK